MVRLLVVSFFSLMVLASFSGQGQRYHFEKITEDDGLSDNRVTCFMKDKTGFMWIGTENGLNRYDGHEFRIYRPGQTQYKISHEHINDIEQDQTGRFWIATWGGLNILDAEKDSITVFLPDDDAYRQKKEGIASLLTWDIYIEKNRVWMALDARDFCYYDQATGKFTYFPWLDFLKEQLPRSTINAYSSIQKIIRKSSHELWLGTTRGLFSFDTRQNRFTFYGGDDGHDFVSLHYDSVHHRVFFGQQKLYTYDIEENSLKEILLQKEKLAEIPKNTILIPSAAGLWELDPSKQQAVYVEIDEKNNFSIHHQIIKQVYHDEAADWIGTSNGARLYTKSLDRFHFIPVFEDTIRSTAGNIYHVLDHEQDNRYYLSSYTQNKLIIIEKNRGTRRDISSIDGKSLDKCTRTFEDSKKRIWVLTNRTIFISDESHSKFEAFQFPREKDEYLFNDMVEDSDGNFWFSSLRKGVFQYNPKTNSWKLFHEKPDGLFAVRPTGLLSDPSHQSVWIGDFSFGVFRYDQKENSFEYNGVSKNNPDFLQSSLTNDLAIDRNGDIWVATTSGGISRYSQKEKKYTTYSMQTGLPESTINAVEADKNGNLWLASLKGLTSMKTSGEIIQHYDQNTGLHFSRFSTPFSINDKGELFIGCGHGFLKFHPDSLRATTPEFPVVITSAKISGIPVTDKSKAEFPYDENEFVAQFSALTYSMPKKVKYYYQLEGFDNKWIEVIDQHSLSYTNLEHGSYKFNIRAVDYAGKDSSNVASVGFIIRAPFWKTWWFIVAICALSGTALFLWIRSLQRKIRSQKILKQIATSLYNQRTYEEVFWTVTKNCIELLHFEDCVVYLIDNERGVLVQKAAGGPKNKQPFQVYNPIEIPVGKGIVGSVAATGKSERINNTSRDKRYILDDAQRQSELSVPILVDGKVFGVIDSEHTQKRFFNEWHLKMVEEIASICSAKISRYFVEEQIRSKVARDLHDDMGSSLSSINIMSKIALEKNDPTISSNYFKSIRENASLMQERLGDIVWAINPQNDTLEKVIIRMKEFAAEILEPQNIQYEFVEQGDMIHTRMDINTRKDFYLIFKESINNAAKYSGCKKVAVHLSHFPDTLTLRMQDDGQGFTPSLNGSGNGLKNMKYRAQAMGAKLFIESTPGNGSSVLLIVHHEKLTRLL
jgi:signal transduction histidine kinase/ligand-binding sensor domain-containing protein